MILFIVPMKPLETNCVNSLQKVHVSHKSEIFL